MNLESLTGIKVDVYSFKGNKSKLKNLLLKEAGLFSQEEDLRHSKKCAEKIHKETDDFMKELLFDSMVIAYGRCFTSHYTSGHLDPGNIYKNNFQIFLEPHKNFMTIRNRIVAHNDARANPALACIFKFKDLYNKNTFCPSYLSTKMVGFDESVIWTPKMIQVAIDFCVEKRREVEKERISECESFIGGPPHKPLSGLIEDEPFYSGLAPVPIKVQQKELQRLCDIEGLEIVTGK